MKQDFPDWFWKLFAFGFKRNEINQIIGELQEEKNDLAVSDEQNEPLIKIALFARLKFMAKREDQSRFVLAMKEPDASGAHVIECTVGDVVIASHRFERIHDAFLTRVRSLGALLELQNALDESGLFCQKYPIDIVFKK